MSEFLAFVSLHSGHHNKTAKERFGLVDSSAPWLNASIDVAELLEHVLAGKAWVGCHLPSGRQEDEACASNLLVLDYDGKYDQGDPTLDAFWANPRAARHCLFTYTTPSHTQSEHRFRAVFMAWAMQGPRLHLSAYHALVDYLGIGSDDKCGEKPERIWYGNTAADVRLGGGEQLPIEILYAAQDAVAAEDERIANPPPRSHEDDGLDNQRVAWALDNILRESNDGEYNSYWQVVFNAAASSGSELVREAFFRWHYKGHHGSSQKKVERRYERGAGRRSTPGKILALAKQQRGVSNCNAFLPEALRYQVSAPVLLGSSFSASDCAPSAPIGGHFSLSQPEATGGDSAPVTTITLGTSFSAADCSPSSGRRTPAQNRAARSLSGSAIGPLTLSSDFGGDDQPDAVEGFMRLLRRLYLLQTHSIFESNGDLQQIPERQVSGYIALIRNELLAYTEFNRSPQLLEQHLLELFRQEHLLERRRFCDVTPVKLSGKITDQINWLVPGFIATGLDHIVFSKPGLGKTTLALQLARRILGDPETEGFLDSGPLTTNRHWRERDVLIIASDGAGAARKILDHYLYQMGHTNAEYLEHLEVWADNEAMKTPAWSLTLRHLRQLHDRLQEGQVSGKPVIAVFIDSMKAVCDGCGLRVGDQVFADYVQLVQDICRHFNCSLIWLHHEAKDGSGSQGVAGITERPSAVFRIKREESHYIFSVEKLRGGKPREIHYVLDEAKEFQVVAAMSSDQGEATSPIERLMDLFDWHFRQYQQDITLPGAAAGRTYPGLQTRDLMELIPKFSVHGIRGVPSSRAQIKRMLASLLDDGLLRRNNLAYMPVDMGPPRDTNQADLSDPFTDLDD